METSSAPSYRIETRSGVFIADELPRSVPSIQLHEGTLSNGDKPPKDLNPGESSTVAYPLVEGRLICRVTRIDRIASDGIDAKPIEFIEPDPIPGKPRASTTASKSAKDAIEGTKAHRGRGRKAIS